MQARRRAGGHRHDKDARGVRAQLAAGRRRAGQHLGQDVAPPLGGLPQSHLHDLQRDALNLNTRRNSVQTEVGSRPRKADIYLAVT
jgi:hypothetical protein